MSALFTYLTLLLLVVFLAAILWEFFRGAPRRKVFLELCAVVLGVVVLRWTTGFPVPVSAFGPSAALLSILVLFAGVILGTAANYIFYQRARFEWRGLLKPLVLSPLVLLPLLGSLQLRSELTEIQWVSVFCLAFQNGFFWRMVVKDAAKRLR